MNTTSAGNSVWTEYDDAAEWCARRGLTGERRDALPPLMSAACHEAINDDPEGFQDRVKDTAYMLAMESHTDTWNCPRHGEVSRDFCRVVNCHAFYGRGL